MNSQLYAMSDEEKSSIYDDKQNEEEEVDVSEHLMKHHRYRSSPSLSSSRTVYRQYTQIYPYIRRVRLFLTIIAVFAAILFAPTINCYLSDEFVDDGNSPQPNNYDQIRYEAIINNNYPIEDELNDDSSAATDNGGDSLLGAGGAGLSQQDQNNNNNNKMATTKQISFVSPKQKLSSGNQFWYEAPLSFSAKGMDHLYLLNHLLWSWLQPPGLPSEVIKKQLFEDPETVAKQNKVRLLTHFWGMILATAIAVCFAAIIPLLGLLLCCCSCGNTKKRAKTSPSTSSHHHQLHNQPHHSHHQPQSQPHCNEQDSPTNYTGAANIGGQSRNKSRGSGGGGANSGGGKRCRYSIEKRCDPCYRSCFGTLLFILLLLITFFVICAFVTNEYIDNGLRELPKTLNQSLDDYQLYLNNTQYEVNTLLRANFAQLEQALDKSLDESGMILKNRLAFVTHAMSLDNLTEIVSKLEVINSDLNHLQTETGVLRNHLHTLRRGLLHVKKNLENVFKECEHPICKQLRKRYESIIKRIEVSSHLDDLPDISIIINNITYLLDSKIVEEVNKGKQHFDKISLKIQTAVKDSIPSIKEQIGELGKKLSSIAKDVNEHLRAPFDDIGEMKKEIQNGSEFFNKYELYRWYVCLAASSAILLILALYTTGLLNCVCKNQPTYHDYRVRGTKPPSSFSLKCGVVLLFLLFGVLLVGTIGLFLIGGAFDRIGCYYLEHPSEPDSRKLFVLIQNVYNQYHNPELYDPKLDTIDDELDGEHRTRSMNVKMDEKGLKKLSYIDVLNNCHNNESLYNALQLYKYGKVTLTGGDVIHGFNVSNIIQYENRDGIERGLKVFLKQVDFDPGRIVILTKEANRLLESLKQTSFSGINFTLYSQLVNKEIIPLNLIELSQEIDREAELLPPSQIDHKSELNHAALMLDSLQTKVLSKIQDSVLQLKVRSEKIEKKAQYGGKSLKEALNDLLNLAIQAQNSIEKRGRTFIKEVAEGFVNDINSLIDQYYQHVINEVEKEIGRCEPISRAVNASVMAVCKEIVLPFNGYWLSMASALFLCLPATICATILSNLIRKFKRSKDMRRYTHEDSDTHIDNYEEDDIPLAHYPHNRVVNKETTSSSNPYDPYRRPHPSTGLYLEETCASIPSAPLPGTDDNWSPGAPPPHIYSRPPPYNFN